MSYIIKLRILNETDDELKVIAKHTYPDCTWTHIKKGFALNMPSSGNAGGLLFTTSSGEKFDVAIGVHNYNRWVDIGLHPQDTIVDVLQKYYTSGTEEDLNRWKVLSVIKSTTAKGRRISITFVEDEGNALEAVMVYSHPSTTTSTEDGDGDTF